MTRSTVPIIESHYDFQYRLQSKDGAYQKALKILQKESGPEKYGEGKSYRDLLEELIRMYHLYFVIYVWNFNLEKH